MMMIAVILNYGQVYHIGDLYTAPDGSKGIVYYVNTDGSCWVVALNDIPMYMKWGSTVDVPDLPEYGANSPGSYPICFPLQALADTAGYSNTVAIFNFNSDQQTAAHGVDLQNGWYLPAAGQLCMLLSQMPFIEIPLISAGGSLLDDGQYTSYWSSTELNYYQAWTVNTSMPDPPPNTFIYSHSAEPTPEQKSSQRRVRPVRTIPPPQNYYDTTLTYLWNAGSSEPHFSDVPLQTTDYSVTVSNVYGCTNSASVAVMVIDNEPQTVYDTICQGATYSNYGFSLSAEETENVGEITFTQTVSANGCESEVTLYLTVLASDLVEIEEHAEQSFVWNGVTYTEEGIYTQYFNNQYGCDSTVVLTLTLDGGVDPGPGPGPDTTAEDVAEQMLYLPNAFTPNEDGRNPVFLPIFRYPEEIEEYQMEIYNRWGVLVFISEEQRFGWDGANGMEGVYVVKVYYKTRGKKPQTVMGSVTLIR